jgi:hypothetical protein
LPRQINRGPADDENPVRVSEGLGGVTGAAAGAGLGALLGPAGIVIGGIAGAVGGWWAGHGVGEATDDFGDETDAHYRRLHETDHADAADYDSARSFYHLGAVARRNPDYRGRNFDEIETDLRRGWRDDVSDRFRSWDDVRPFVRTGYERAPDGPGD